MLISNQTSAFLNHVLPIGGKHAVVVKDKQKGFFKHVVTDSIDELVQRICELDHLEQDVYFACASYSQGFYLNDHGKKCFRTAENAGWAKSFWLDIDCGYNKAEEGKGYIDEERALCAIANFCQTISLPLPTIVLSGGGLHCYFVLANEIPKEQWLHLAKRMKALTHHYDLLADDSRTSDIASILRPVGTHNWKPERKGKQVKLHHLSEPIPFESFAKLIDDAFSLISPAEVVERNLPKIDFPETDENIKRVKAALMLLNPNCDRAFWRDICFALHSLGWSCSKDLAKSWSRGGLI